MPSPEIFPQARTDATGWRPVKWLKDWYLKSPETLLATLMLALAFLAAAMVPWFIHSIP